MILEGNIAIPYKWTTGPTIGRFLAELRDNARLAAARCNGCGKVYLPPPDVCGACFKPVDDWVILSGEGVVIAATTVHRAAPMSALSPPYTLGLIRLDGADTNFIHILKEGVSAGERVRAAFKSERVGSILDIDCFVATG